MSDSPQFYRHGLRRMLARDPDERQRSASPLELFFDLTFVAAFLTIGEQVALGVADGLVWPVVLGFVIATLPALWAWMEYTWLASAFDNDDWVFRALTLLQMAGVIILTIGMPALFASLVDGGEIDGRVLVAGYVVMRTAITLQWLRVARHDASWRRFALGHAVAVGVVQALWVAWIVVPLAFTPALVFLAVVWVLDLAVPTTVARLSKPGGPAALPWHPSHLAERYGLITIIALGETVIGTVTAARHITDTEGWNADTVAAVGIGIVISFALWWTYFLMPSARILEVRRDKMMPWAYGHLPMLASVVAVGGGLHVLGYLHDSRYPASILTAVVAVAIPTLLFLICVHGIHGWLVSRLMQSPAHIVALGAPLVAIATAAIGWPVWLCLILVLCGPLTIVVSYEVRDHRRLESTLRSAIARAEREPAA